MSISRFSALSHLKLECRWTMTSHQKYSRLFDKGNGYSSYWFYSLNYDSPSFYDINVCLLERDETLIRDEIKSIPESLKSECGNYEFPIKIHDKIPTEFPLKLSGYGSLITARNDPDKLLDIGCNEILKYWATRIPGIYSVGIEKSPLSDEWVYAVFGNKYSLNIFPDELKYIKIYKYPEDDSNYLLSMAPKYTTIQSDDIDTTLNSNKYGLRYYSQKSCHRKIGKTAEMFDTESESGTITTSVSYDDKKYLLSVGHSFLDYAKSGGIELNDLSPSRNVYARNVELDNPNAISSHDFENDEFEPKRLGPLIGECEKAVFSKLNDVALIRVNEENESIINGSVQSFEEIEEFVPGDCKFGDQVNIYQGHFKDRGHFKGILSWVKFGEYEYNRHLLWYQTRRHSFDGHTGAAVGPIGNEKKIGGYLIGGNGVYCFAQPITPIIEQLKLSL